MSEKDDKPDHVFDAQAAYAQLGAVSAALLAARRARQSAKAAATARQFALNTVRSLEPVIVGMFEDGASVNEVLALIQSHLPAVPSADLRYALAYIRERHRLHDLPNAAVTRPAGDVARAKPKPAATPPKQAERKAQSKGAPPKTAEGTAPAAAPASKAPSAECKPTQHSTIPSARLPDWADWSDLMPGESDDDYIFRKSLEMPPETQRKFIGEHNR